MLRARCRHAFFAVAAAFFMLRAALHRADKRRLSPAPLASEAFSAALPESSPPRRHRRTFRCFEPASPPFRRHAALPLICPPPIPCRLVLHRPLDFRRRLPIYSSRAAASVLPFCLPASHQFLAIERFDVEAAIYSLLRRRFSVDFAHADGPPIAICWRHYFPIFVAFFCRLFDHAACHDTPAAMLGSSFSACAACSRLRRSFAPAISVMAVRCFAIRQCCRPPDILLILLHYVSRDALCVHFRPLLDGAVNVCCRAADGLHDTAIPPMFVVSLLHASHACAARSILAMLQHDSTPHLPPVTAIFSSRPPMPRFSIRHMPPLFQP